MKRVQQRGAKPVIIVIALSVALAGCAGQSPQSYYRKHPHGLMREVVKCENNGGALAATPACQAALRVNDRLFY
ncbi:MAG TPA: EexN family lipoprotein [Acidiphilium sp.]|nr:EexN family lipoprotein [Acidiphilium sp.]HQU24788.1 EexN family lipoprotein [Acidiphilium sp.]